MRLIDADKLKKHYTWWGGEEKEMFDTIVDMQPTIEAEPIRHGKWCDGFSISGNLPPIFTKSQGFQTVKCSVCNITQSVNTYQNKVMFRFCPYCGAKMDGKEAGENETTD